MPTKKSHKDYLGGALLIFSAQACLCRRLPSSADRERMLLSKEDTGLSADVTLALLRRDGQWQIGEKILTGENPFYYYTEKEEKLLLLLASGQEALHPAEKLHLKRKEELKIGSAFRNQIFYECFSLVEECHARICAEEQGITISGDSDEGIYVNGQALREKRILHSGDEAEIYGLHLLLLEETLICTCHAGIFRTAKGRGSEWEKKQVLSCAGKKSREGELIERECVREERLYTGELEILLPEKPAAEREQPLFLTIGPSLTMVLPMLLMAELGSRYMGNNGGGFYYLSVAMSGCSALLAVFWGLIGHGCRRYDRRKERREKERRYREYLEETEQYLQDARKANNAVLGQKYPPVSTFLEEGKGAPVVLWNRYYRQRDFLFLRLGTGAIPFQMKVRLSENRRSIVEEKQAAWARELAEEYQLLKQAPVGIDLGAVRQLGVVWGHDREGACGMLLQLLLQTAACHCYTEVKLACFYNKDRFPDREIAGCLKWLPHVWTADGKMRLLAGDEKEAGEILPVLTRELAGVGIGTNGQAASEGKESGGISLPWYIVFVLDQELIWGEPLYQYLTESEGACRASAVFAEENREQLPKSCRCYYRKGEEEGEILSLGDERVERQRFIPELCSRGKALSYVRGIAGFRVKEAAGEGKLPEQVGFLELFGCKRVEELASGSRWQQARTGERLKAPIGVGTGGNLISLDIHEKFHGPHGLIAGTTGSGKSELLQTYLLSMAITYSPVDVNFFLIDYKGGGTGNLLKALPHCAGVISNLSGKQIGRALSAISSENKRRQRLLNSCQVNHIDAYTRLYREGGALQAMPHLLLVVDEFAELKKEEPEFMQEIISLAQVGRSLGIHLILATQKPAGTVDDKIWSNARFRLCLRVQDMQDSMDMLHNKDAAYLTAPGQCYLQIGNHEYYELFQAGYCGGSYREEGEEKEKAALVSNTGKRLKAVKDKGVEAVGSQMEVLTEYIIQTAREENYPGADPLWLPELPKKILLGEISAQVSTQISGQKAGRSSNAVSAESSAKALGLREPVFVLGLCDDPENQRRFVLTYEPADQGHLALCAGPAAGKTTFLQMLLWQICQGYEPWEAQLLAVDVGQENLGDFGSMPHCLGVLKEKEELDIFFYHLERLMEERKSLLSGLSCTQYNRSGKGRLPYLFVAVDNLGGLKKIWEEKQEELFMKLAAEGLTLGIYLLLTASGAGEIGGRLFEKIKTTLALEMSDRFQYGDVLRQYYLPVLPEENCKGRGLCKAEGRVLEFQTALIEEGQEDFAYSGRLKALGQKRTLETGAERESLPVKFPVLPKQVDFEKMTVDFDWSRGKLPLGYSLSTGEIKGISPKEVSCFLISGRAGTGRDAVLGCLIEGALRLGRQAVILDEEGRLSRFQERVGVVYLRNGEEVEDWRLAVRESSLSESKVSEICVFIGNLGRFCHFLCLGSGWREASGRGAGEASAEGKERFWEQAAMGQGPVGFLAGVYDPERDQEAASTGFFREFAAWQQGIHLGGNAAEQRALSFDDISYTLQSRREAAGTGYLKEGPGSSTCRVRVPVEEKEKR